MKNLVTRKINNTNVKCVIPQLLPGKVLSEKDNINIGLGIELEDALFSPSNFFSRYLAGGRSIKEARKVSRKRLALVTSQMGYFDPEALALQSQIMRYQKAKSYLMEAKVIAAEDIMTVNKILHPESSISGRFRTVQNWVGGSSFEKAYYFPPPPEFIDKLIKNLLEFFYNKNFPYALRVIVAHIQLQNIHPFVDGNGRTARVFLDACIDKSLGYRIHPCLYRLVKQDDSYIDALHAILDDQDNCGINHPFWERSFSFGESLLKSIKKIIYSTSIKLQAKIALYSLQTNSIKLFKYLWKQPIVCEKGLEQYFGWDFYTAQLAIKDLLNVKILEQRQLANPSNAIIYNCPIILESWKKIDDQLFNNNII